MRIRRKLAALNKENCGEHLRGNLAQKSMLPDHKRTISLNFLKKLKAE